MKRLIFLMIAILFSMLAVTTWASLNEDIVSAIARLTQEPWVVASLFDAYFGFIFFFLWVLFKENSLIARVLWFVLIMLLGNIAMSIYVLMKIYEIKNQFTFERLLTYRKSAEE